VSAGSYDADVIVAGGGPAGAVAAARLAEAGFATIVVDRALFPRHKPCGGGVSIRALRRFPWLAAAVRDIDVHRIQQVHLEGPLGAALDITDREPLVLLIRRIEFDRALLARAEAAGARFVGGFEITQAEQDGRCVTIQARDGRRLRARMAVAADGVHSVLARRLGVNARWPRTQLAIDMMEETPVATLRATAPDVLWVAYGHDGLDGYAYVFPKVRHVNVGVGCVLAHFDAHVDARPYDLQRALVASLVARGALEGRSDPSTFTPFLIPIGGPLPRAAHGRVLFTGDAGGFVHPITAEGIYYAMVTGDLAARALVEIGAAAPARAAARYESLWQGEIGAELWDAVRVQRYLFSSRQRIARAVTAAAESRVARLMLDYFKGHVPYRALRRRMIWTFPMTIVRLARMAATWPTPAVEDLR